MNTFAEQKGAPKDPCEKTQIRFTMQTDIFGYCPPKITHNICHRVLILAESMTAAYSAVLRTCEGQFKEDNLVVDGRAS